MRSQSVDDELQSLRAQVEELKRDKLDLRDLVELQRSELAQLRAASEEEVRRLRHSEALKREAERENHEGVVLELKKKIGELEEVARMKVSEAYEPEDLFSSSSNLLTQCSTTDAWTYSTVPPTQSESEPPTFDEWLAVRGGLDHFYPPRKREAHEGPETAAERKERRETARDVYKQFYPPPKRKSRRR